MVSKQSEKRNIKMIFFKTILIQLPYNPFKYIFVHMRQKKTFQSLVVCVMQKYRLLLSSFTRHNDEKSEKKYKRKLLCKSVKALRVIAILTAYL
jgi:hypothetical protein